MGSLKDIWWWIYLLRKNQCISIACILNEILLVMPLAKRALKFTKYTRMHLQPTQIFFPRKSFYPTPPPPPSLSRSRIPSPKPNYACTPRHNTELGTLLFSPATYYWNETLPSRLSQPLRHTSSSHTKFNHIISQKYFQAHNIWDVYKTSTFSLLCQQ